MNNACDFIDDYEKMDDFFNLTESEFLNSYSYLSKADYDLTWEIVSNMTDEGVKGLKSRIESNSDVMNMRAENTLTINIERRNNYEMQGIKK